MTAQDGMTRIARLYAKLEQMRSLELQRATSARNDVECATALQSAVIESLHIDGREALIAGDRVEWKIAETDVSIAERNRDCLHLLLDQRKTQVAEALAAHRAARLQWKQVDCVKGRAEALASAQDDRRTQAAADDRFAARRVWSAMRHR